MTEKFSMASRLAMFVVLTGFAVGGAWADKPEWAGKNNAHKADRERHDDQDRHEDRDRHEGNPPAAARHGFDDDSRRLVHDYYGSRFRAGKCPPGLAKKHNGCMPPGQAKKWTRGQPIPQDVRFYELPKDLRAHLPPPPPEHRYVRVASDILLVAIGTQMVVDAIEDIGRAANR